jgi:hypothetical protein
MTAVHPGFGPPPLFSVAVYSPDGKIPKILRDCLGSDVDLVPVDPANWDRTDVYISPGGLSWQSERSASALGAPIIVLPEASGWLHERIKAAREPLRLFVAARQGDRPNAYLTRKSA